MTRHPCTHHPDRRTALHRADGVPLCLSCWLEERGRTLPVALSPGQVGRLAGRLSAAELYTLTRRAYAAERLRLVRGVWG